MQPRVVEVLGRELALLVSRARDLQPRRWAAPIGPFASRADAVFHLAAVLAQMSGAPVPLPRLDSPMALPDQLAVVGHDLLAAGPDEVAAANALAEALLHRYDLDGAAPGRAAAEAALSVLAPGRSSRGLLALARTHCPISLHPRGRAGWATGLPPCAAAGRCRHRPPGGR